MLKSLMRKKWRVTVYIGTIGREPTPVRVRDFKLKPSAIAYDILHTSAPIGPFLAYAKIERIR